MTEQSFEKPSLIYAAVYILARIKFNFISFCSFGRAFSRWGDNTELQKHAILSVDFLSDFQVRLEALLDYECFY